MPDQRPIGVFDSGVGGLTVLRALQQRLPLESTVYIGDLARCPYGTRNQREVQEFACQIADLLSRENIKLLVVACNTATAAAYEILRRRYAIPVVGVIEPGVRAAVKASRRGRIGVVATDGTVASGAYRRALYDVAPWVEVTERSASWLVPIIEWGPLARPVVAARLQPMLAEMRALDVDAVILGCTHFPLVRDIFEAEVGPLIEVVDSATTTVSEVTRVLGECDSFADAPARHRLLVTGPAEAFAERAQAMFRASPVIETIRFDALPAL